MVHGRLTHQAVLAICYQGVIVAGICFIIWAELLKRHAAGTVVDVRVPGTRSPGSL
jgi:hypothetical protein